MIFFDWWLVGWVILCLAMVAAGVYGLRHVPKISGLFRRVVAGIASVGSALLGSLVLLLFWVGSGCVSYSSPIYSPSGTMAARIENADEGATGGSTWVELYWSHGLKKKMIFSAPAAWAAPSDVHWESDSKLTIHYQGFLEGDGFPTTNVAGVKVECSPRPLR